MHIIQDILIILLAGYMTIDLNGPVVMSWFSVIVGTISGLIMGDLNTGLMIGGTFQLMSLGVAALGGASAPNYGLATIIGTFIAVRTGTGIDAAVGVGLPVGLLAIQLEVVVRIVNNFVAHKMQSDNNEGKWHDVYIKVIRDNTTIKDTFIANLVDESMMMSNIDCDNVANILDVITDESKYYIVSEYFNGISLFDLVNKNNITLDNIINTPYFKYLNNYFKSSMKI